MDIPPLHHRTNYGVEGILWNEPDRPWAQLCSFCSIIFLGWDGKGPHETHHHSLFPHCFGKLELMSAAESGCSPCLQFLRDLELQVKEGQVSDRIIQSEVRFQVQLEGIFRVGVPYYKLHILHPTLELGTASSLPVIVFNSMQATVVSTVVMYPIAESCVFFYRGIMSSDADAA